MTSKKELRRKNRRLREKIGVIKHELKQERKDRKLWKSIVESQDEEIEQLKAPKVTMTDSNGNMADMTMVKNSGEIVLQDEYKALKEELAFQKDVSRSIENLATIELKALEQSHKQYQDLFAKIIALMVDELGVDIVRVFVDEHEQPETMAHWGD